jgi:hypothetical protein
MKFLNYRSAGPLSVPVPVPVAGTGTGTKRKLLAGPEPGPGPGPNKKSYRDLGRDQKKLVPHMSSRASFVRYHLRMVMVEVCYNISWAFILFIFCFIANRKFREEYSNKG